MNTHHFGKYTLRPATEDDILMATAWVAADPWHAHTTLPEFFVTQDRGVECYVLEDEHGPVFFFRMSRALRLDIQFGPRERNRTRDALMQGFHWLITPILQAGIHQVIFDSENPELIASCVKRLGFRSSPHELVREFAGIVGGKEATNVRSDCERRDAG